MFEEDQETLAAEYVLGTLSAEEREHAEALRSFDPEFDAAVKQWERRLGELNVMVEAVEPPAEVWDKIKGEIGAEMPGEADAAAETESVPDLESPATVDATDFLFAEDGDDAAGGECRRGRRNGRLTMPLHRRRSRPSARRAPSAAPMLFGCGSGSGAGAASPSPLRQSRPCWRPISPYRRSRPI